MWEELDLECETNPNEIYKSVFFFEIMNVTRKLKEKNNIKIQQKMDNQVE